MSRITASATLRIIGDKVVPEDCTKLLKLKPTRAWGKDQLYISVTGHEVKRLTGLWVLESEFFVDSDDPVVHAEYMFEKFKSCKKPFEILTKTQDAKITFYIEWAISHGTYSLPRDLLERILALGIHDVSFTFIGLDDPEEAQNDTENTVNKSKGKKCQVSLFNNAQTSVILVIEGYNPPHCIDKKTHKVVENIPDGLKTIQIHSNALKRHAWYTFPKAVNGYKMKNIQQFHLQLQPDWSLLIVSCLPYLPVNLSGEHRPVCIKPHKDVKF